MRKRLVFLAALIAGSCERVPKPRPEEIRAFKAIGYLTKVNEAEARFELHFGRYGSLPEVHMISPPEGFSVNFNLAAAIAYTVGLLPNDKHSHSYFSDQTMTIRQCPGPEERSAATCPAIGDALVLIAHHPASVPGS